MGDKNYWHKYFHVLKPDIRLHAVQNFTPFFFKKSFYKL